jgi:glycosyltransferase involved in cell wall biosynthesis
MGQGLRAVYETSSSQSFALSNSAFLDEAQLAARIPQAGDHICVGFLSNITREKGIFEFFALMKSARESGIQVSGIVAGPVDRAIQSEFVVALENEPNVRYLGSVEADRKNNFFWSIDILFFPTLYENEAEPVTILEAMSNGVVVVAYSRGCIAELIQPGAGSITHCSPSGQKEVVRLLARFAEDKEALVTSARFAQDAFLQMQEINRVRLESLLDLIGRSGEE